MTVSVLEKKVRKLREHGGAWGEYGSVASEPLLPMQQHAYGVLHSLGVARGSGRRLASITASRSDESSPAAAQLRGEESFCNSTRLSSALGWSGSCLSLAVVVW